MEPTVTVRSAAPADADAIVRFQLAMARETENKDLDAGTVYAGVRGLLARPAHGFYLIAERGGVVAGSLMVTPEWSDWRGGFFWWVQSVYVDPAHRRQGLYRALYEEVLARGRALGEVIGVRLYVEGSNTGAREVYLRLGMQETGYRLYETSLSSS
ncbi:MAG: N-acetyltransferase [Planctomycetota bacterium]|nr:N-acetyltransferase [Planctomycetota bacterium]